jgi:membrane protein YdbS with pleckstrin-like domain
MIENNETHHSGQRAGTTEQVEEFHLLDPRAISLWRTKYLVRFGIFILVMLGVAVSLGITVPAARIWMAIGWMALTAFGLWFSFWFPARYYRTWRWRIDAKVLEIRSGRLVERARLIPLNRLQHVDLERGLFERMYGLSSLIIHTAGTHVASTRIPGLEADAAARLRDHLVEIGGDDAV